MTDEQIGRDYAARHGIVPEVDPDIPSWSWDYMEPIGWLSPGLSEAEAYAILGRRVRELRAKGVLT